jgi:hypothetical protein
MIEITWQFSNDFEGPKILVLKMQDYQWYSLRNYLDTKFVKLREIYTDAILPNVLYIRNNSMGWVYNCPLKCGMQQFEIDFFLTNYKNFFYDPNIEHFNKLTESFTSASFNKIYNSGSGSGSGSNNDKKQLLDELTLDINETIRRFYIKKGVY